MRGVSRIQGLREFFVLKDAEARSTKLPADVRASLARDVTIARQKREAAEVLWLGGGTAEALALARDALDRIATAVEHAHAVDAAPPVPEAAAALRSEVTAKPLPALDADVVDADTPRFNAMLAAHDELRSLVEPAATPPTELPRKRLVRAAWAAGAVAALVVGAIYLGRTPRVLSAQASAAYDDAHIAAKAVDGRNETEWLPLDKQLGWLDVTVLPARKVKRVKLLNGHNPPHNDRQTKEYRLVLTSAGGKVLKTVDNSFGEFSASPTMVTIDVNTSEKVEKIRVEVKSFHNSGAAIAEVEVE